MAPTVMAIRPEILLAGKATGRAIAALTHRPIKNRLLLVTLLAIALPLLAACGQTASSTPGSTLPAETALEQARQAMAAVQSYGFYVDIGVSNYNGGEPVRSARGVWAVPNKYRLQFENVGQVDASVREIISAGDRTLTIHSDGFQWEIDPDLEQHSVFPSNPFDPSSFSIIPELAQLELQGDAKVDGTDVYHLTGLAPPSEDTDSFEPVIGYDLFIGKEDMLLRRLRTSVETNFPFPETKITQTTVYTYFDYNAPVDIYLPPADPCNRSKEPGRWLDCGRLSQRVYWLDEQLAVPGAPSLTLNHASIDNQGGDQAITEDSVLTIVYAAEDTSAGVSEVAIKQWRPGTWREYLSKYPNLDPETPPTGGSVNWWQHPCVEKEVYENPDGAEVHLFQAHLPSLLYIYPMSKEEVGQCLNDPVGAVGAHVYFEETVIEFSVQDSVSPAGPPAQVLIPGATPPAGEPPPYPRLLITSRNPFNNVETARLIAASLKPYQKA